MGANIENFVKDMMPLYARVNEAGQLGIGDASKTELEAKVDEILKNQEYNSLLEAPARNMLTILITNVKEGKLSLLAKQVNHLSQLISQTLIDKNDPKTAVAFAMKIDDPNVRDGLLRTAVKKFPCKTAQDFAAVREVVNSIQYRISKNYVLYHDVLTPLFQRYQETLDPSLLNEIWAAAILIPTGSDANGLAFRTEALTRLVGYISERPNLRIERSGKNLIIGEMEAKKYPNPKNERKHSIWRLIQGFAAEKVVPRELAAGMLLFEDKSERYRALKLLLTQCKKDSEDRKIVLPIFQGVVKDMIAEQLQKNKFSAAKYMLPDLTKADQAKWDETIVQKADHEIARCLKEGGMENIKKAKGYLYDFGADQEFVQPRYRDNWTAWNDAIMKSQGKKI